MNGYAIRFGWRKILFLLSFRLRSANFGRMQMHISSWNMSLEFIIRINYRNTTLREFWRTVANILHYNIIRCSVGIQKFLWFKYVDTQCKTIVILRYNKNFMTAIFSFYIWVYGINHITITTFIFGANLE